MQEAQIWRNPSYSSKIPSFPNKILPVGFSLVHLLWILLVVEQTTWKRDKSLFPLVNQQVGLLRRDCSITAEMMPLLIINHTGTWIDSKRKESSEHAYSLGLRTKEVKEITAVGMRFLLSSLHDNTFIHTIHGAAMSQTWLSSITTTMTLNIYNCVFITWG